MSYKKFFTSGFAIFFFLLSLPCAFSSQFSGQATPVPWSGYWWPFRYGGIATGIDYLGNPAPLEKYLLLTTASVDGRAKDYFIDDLSYYDPDAEGWWGLCPAYARSAVKENYPVLPSVHDNIVFRVGDKKGLLALCHDDRTGVIYASGDSPKNFHEWLLYYIGEKQVGIAADLNPDSQVWYYPIVAYEMETRQEGFAEQVYVTIFYAGHSGDINQEHNPDYIGTILKDKKYTYELELNSQGAVIGGRWTGSSISDHPKTLSYPENPGSLNPYLDCAEIRKIAKAIDDQLELPGNLPARLLPGSHNLVLLDEDNYCIQGSPGDQASIEITRQPGSSETINMLLSDRDGDILLSESLTESGHVVWFMFTMQNPPYTLSFSQANYRTDPGIYSVIFDYQGANTNNVPYIPKQGQWIGFSITNPGDDDAEVMAVTSDTENTPMQTVLEPTLLASGEKLLFHFSDLPVRSYEYPSTEYLRFISDRPVNLVNLFAGNAGPMAGFSAQPPLSSRLIIPEISANQPWDQFFMTGGILNGSFSDVSVDFKIYTRDGLQSDSVSGIIPARGSQVVRSGKTPLGQFPEGGWVEISARDSQACLSGYQYLRKTGPQAGTMETGFGLPVTPGSKFVQHVTPPEGAWQTLLTLINPNSQANTVTIHPSRAGRDRSGDIHLEMEPFEKMVINVSEPFGDVPGLGRSILEVSSRLSVAGQVRYDADGGDSVSYPLLDMDSFKSELIMPHAAYNKGRWWTGVGVCNPGLTKISVWVLPYDKDGRAMTWAEESMDFEPGQYRLFTIHKMFPGIADDIGFLRIYSENPENAKIGGFFLYGNSEWKNPEVFTRGLISGGNM